MVVNMILGPSASHSIINFTDPLGKKLSDTIRSINRICNSLVSILPEAFVPGNWSSCSEMIIIRSVRTGSVYVSMTINGGSNTDVATASYDLSNALASGNLDGMTILSSSVSAVGTPSSTSNTTPNNTTPNNTTPNNTTPNNTTPSTTSEESSKGSSIIVILAIAVPLGLIGTTFLTQVSSPSFLSSSLHVASRINKLPETRGIKWMSGYKVQGILDKQGCEVIALHLDNLCLYYQLINEINIYSNHISPSPSKGLTYSASLGGSVPKVSGRGNTAPMRRIADKQKNTITGKLIELNKRRIEGIRMLTRQVAF